MTKLFIDTETTGLDDEDCLCEVAYQIEDGEMVEERFKPTVPIKVGAMAVSHITNDMVKDKPVFQGSLMQADLWGMNNDGYIFIAHNAPFDLRMLDREGVVFDTSIDTKKLSHALDTEDSMESHRLQYLRYYYGIEMPEAIAHSAEGDVAVLKAVYERLVLELGNPTIEEQIAISDRPILYSILKFGKYKGRKIGDLARTDPQYLGWLLKQKQENTQDEADWIYTLEHYLNNHA